MVVLGDLDHETQPVIHLTITVTDDVRYTSSLLTLIVDDVDEPPVFINLPAATSVYENLTAGTAVYKVMAYDPEGKPVSLNDATWWPSDAPCTLSAGKMCHIFKTSAKR